MSEPNFQDRARSKITGVTGTVIAKYPMPVNDAFPDIVGGGYRKRKPKLKDIRNVIDVRLDDGDRDVWYCSPAENWETTRAYDEEMEE